MAIQLPFKITKTQIVAFISILLNLLGGTGTIQPLVGGDRPACPPPPATTP